MGKRLLFLILKILLKNIYYLNLLFLCIQRVVSCPIWVLELNLGPLQEQDIPLTAELSLLTLFCYLNYAYVSADDMCMWNPEAPDP